MISGQSNPDLIDAGFGPRVAVRRFFLMYDFLDNRPVVACRIAAKSAGLNSAAIHGFPYDKSSMARCEGTILGE